MILSDDSEVGVFIPFKHVYIILTQQNKSSSTYFFFSLFSKFPGDVCFNEDPMLQLLTLMLSKAPAAGEALCSGVDAKKQVLV